MSDDVSIFLGFFDGRMLIHTLGEEDSAYSTGTYSPDYSPQPHNAHPNDSRYFPETNYFPPPPTAPIDNSHGPYPAYNPADYPPGQQHNYGPPPAGYVQPPHDDVNLGNPYAPQHQQHDPYYNQQRRHDDNVSAPAPINSGDGHVAFASARGGSRQLPAHKDEHSADTPADHVDEPDAPSPVPSREKSVQFDLNPQEEPSRKSSPETEHKSRDEHDDRRHGRQRKDDRHQDSSKKPRRDGERHRRHDSPSSDASDSTIELPARFDDQGQKRPHDPVADRLESVLRTLFR